MRTCVDDDGMDALGVFTDQAPSCVRKLPPQTRIIYTFTSLVINILIIESSLTTLSLYPT